MLSPLIHLLVSQRLLYYKDGFKMIRHKELYLLLLSLMVMRGALWSHPLMTQSTLSLTEPPLPKGTLLLNTLQNPSFSLKLFYGDSDNAIQYSFNLSPQNMALDGDPYMPYSGDFVKLSQHDKLLTLVNNTLTTQGKKNITDFKDCIYLNGYHFVSLNHGLTTFYLINLDTGDVMTCPNAPQVSEEDYIYHISLGTHAYYVLSYQPTLHQMTWYALSTQDLSILDSKVVIPPITFNAHKDACALDANGTLYFVSTYELLALTDKGPIHLPLNFTPEKVFYQKGQVYTLSFSDLFLNYGVLSQDLSLSWVGQAHLPNKKATLVTCFLENQRLYTIFEDTLHPTFRHYITLYDLVTHEMLYCLALKDEPYAFLLGGQLQCP